MASGNVDELELELEEKYIASDLASLQAIARNLELTTTAGYTSKLSIIKDLRKHTDSCDNIEEKVNLFKNILGFFGGGGDSSESNDQIDNKKIIEGQVEILEAQLNNLKMELGQSVGEQKNNAASLLEQTLSRTMLKKEFKITGMIHDQKSDKPSLNYISLIHQIQAGQRANYSDAEIISGVIKSMTPGLKLRTVLETLPNLKLPRLRLMLRSHYSEKSAAELFQSLTNSIQGVSETADEFLIRIYEIRQKLVFARKESGSIAVPYNDSLIQNIFINTIETGITDEAIRNKIRRYLITPKEGQTEEDFDKVNDKLIQQVTMAAAVELERNEKIKAANRRRTGVSAISFEEDSRTTDSHQSASGTKKKVGFSDESNNSQLIATLQAIQSQLGTLRLDVNNLKASGYSSSSERRPSRPRCKTCTNDNIDYCDHCLKCGASDHFARGCKNTSASSTNFNRR